MAEGKSKDVDKSRYTWGPTGKVHPRLSVAAGNPSDPRRAQPAPEKPEQGKGGKSYHITGLTDKGNTP